MIIETKQTIDLNIEELVFDIIDNFLECNAEILDYANNANELSSYSCETIGDVIKGKARKELYTAIGNEFLKRANS